jgi:uncharacterized protein
MIREDRYVFDTGVLVSAAIFPESIPRRALSEGLQKGQLVLSPATAEELQNVLGRPKFDRYMSHQVRQRFLANLVDRARVVEPNQTFNVCRDPKDNKFLEVAVCCKASFLVTGDKDLLVLNPFQGVPIVTPSDYLENLLS